MPAWGPISRPIRGCEMRSSLTEKLRIVFLGTAEFAVPTLRTLARGPDEVVAVVTRPDRPAGRGRRLRPSPVKQAAGELGLALLQPARVSAPEGVAKLRQLSPDLLFVVAFGEILREEALSVPERGAINLHASLLPRYRGAAPIPRALMAGEKETGVTLQWMARETDAGDIILQRAAAILPEEDAGSLAERLAALGAEAAVTAIELVRAGTAPSLSQDEEEITYAPPIRREELVIDWGRTAASMANHIRALSPLPGARTTHNGRLLKILAAGEAKSDPGERGIPGEVMEVTKSGFLVQTGSGGLLVLRVQPEGRRTMSASDYTKGYRLRRGDRLGN